MRTRALKGGADPGPLPDDRQACHVRIRRHYQMDGDEPDVKQNRIVAFTGRASRRERGATFAEMKCTGEISRDFYLAHPQEFSTYCCR